MHKMIDFEDPVIAKWTNELIKKYPQLVTEWHGYLPGDPQDPIPFILNKHKSPDWEVWYLYYYLCRASSLEIEYAHIANKLGRTRRTVKGAFLEVQKKLEEERWKLTDTDY